MSYKQLTQEQRYQIYAMKKAGFGQNKIALEIQVHPSTISRELSRNTGRTRLSSETGSAESKSAQSGKSKAEHLAADLAISRNLFD